MAINVQPLYTTKPPTRNQNQSSKDSTFLHTNTIKKSRNLNLDHPMKLLSNPLTFPFFTSDPLASKPFFKPIKASVQAPPPDFDFRNELASDSRAAIASTFPELLDLADNGTLILVQKQSFGPTPPWRKEFVEPESIWLVGTSHISQESAAHVERVVRTVKPDNVAVELCRSRKVFFFLNYVRS